MAVSGDPATLPPDSSGVAIRGGAIRVGGYAAGVLVSLGSATILVRHLGISSFGRYVTVTSLVALVAGMTEAGIAVYGMREWAARADADRRELIANLLTLRLVLATAGIVCATLFGLAVGYRHVLVLGTLVAGAGLLVQVVSDVLSISLQAQLQLGRLTAVELSRRVLALALVAALALLGSGLLPFFAASTFAAAAALALTAQIVRPSIEIRLAFDRQVWRELLAETLPYAVGLSIASIYFYVTVIVMSLIATSMQTGLFGTSFRVTQVALTVPGLLLTAIFPLMARAPATGRDGSESAVRAPGAVVGKVFTVGIICGVWMALAVALSAPFLIDVIGGSHAHAAVPVLRIQAVVLVVSFLSTASAFHLVSMRRYRPLLVASACGLAINILLAVVLVSALGAEGGAIADVVSELLMASGLTVVVMRVVPGHGITGRFLPPVLLASSLAATVLLLPVGSLVRALAATAIYFGVLGAARAIPDEVLAAARQVRALRAQG
jgi:O-antigen/teichoic acid export membrane protein